MLLALRFEHSRFYFSKFLAIAETIVTPAHSLCKSIKVAVTYCGPRLSILCLCFYRSLPTKVTPKSQPPIQPRYSSATPKIDFQSGWEQRDHYEYRPVQFTGNPGRTRRLCHTVAQLSYSTVPLFLNLYKPFAKSVSPDESLLKFKGRLSFVQYMPRKPIKRGMKAFSLNESKTGYTCAWKLYTGADDTNTVYDADVRVNPKSPDCHPPSLTVAGKVIIDLVNGLENKGHIIYCDNYYTIAQLL